MGESCQRPQTPQTRLAGVGTGVLTLLTVISPMPHAAGHGRPAPTTRRNEKAWDPPGFRRLNRPPASLARVATRLLNLDRTVLFGS